MKCTLLTRLYPYGENAFSLMLLGSKLAFLNVNVECCCIYGPIRPAFANALTLIAFKVDGKTKPQYIFSLPLSTL